MTRATASSFALVLLLCSGCGQSSRSQYGSSSGSSGRSSLNGFGALRETYEQGGYNTRDVHRLTERVGRSKVIVWTPQVPQSISANVTRWFDRWLRRGGRTLVYIAPDSGSETEYWEDSLSLAPPEQRLEYRRRLARSRNQRIRWTANRKIIPSNGWFVLEPATQRSQISTLSGDWGVGRVADRDEEILTEYRILEYDSQMVGTNAGGTTTGGTGPGAPGYVYYSPTETTRTKVKFQSVVDSEAGDAIVGQITSDKWKNSKIIVVSGGSLLTNYAFTREFGGLLAQSLVSASSSSGRGLNSGAGATAGFLTTDMMPIPISEPQRGVPQASGMELLTVWPISLVTIHAAMFGFVVCLILWPVFGRPRQVERGTSSNFGDHLDAVAALMNRAGGEQYARNKISEYMRRMHGETSGPWVLPETGTTELLPALETTAESGPTSSPVKIETPQLEPQSEPVAADSVWAMDDDGIELPSSENSGQKPTEDSHDDEANR